MKKIGLIGVGMMGIGIATNIAKHGYPLTVLDHPGNQPLDALKAVGVATVSDASALAAEVDVLMLCVTGTPQVEAVLLGEDGVLKTLKAGAIVIDCSTALPSSTVRVAAAVTDAGGRFLDAAMTRTPKEAAEGRLNLLVGGDPSLFDECRPLLATFAENITHAGPVGAGHRMKLLHNYVSLGFIALLAEAAACSTKAGIDPAVFVDVLAKGGGGGIALERVRPYLLDDDTSALRFSMSNAKKDIGYYTTMAAETDASHALADTLLGTLTWGLAEGGDASMVLELASLLAGRPH